MDKEKRLMKKACAFNDNLYNIHGVISTGVFMGQKRVHLTNKKFFELFDEYEREEHDTAYDKVYVIEDGTEYFALVAF
jgi:hypothetical protein